MLKKELDEVIVMDKVSHAEDSKEDRHHAKHHEGADIDGEGKPTRVVSDDGNRGGGDHSPESFILHSKHTFHNEDVSLTSDKLGAPTKHTPHHEDGQSMHELHNKLASHGVHKHDDGHTDLAQDSPKNASTHGEHTFHKSDADVTHDHSANCERDTHDNEGTEVMHESREGLATHEKHLPNDEQAGIVHGDDTHGKHTHVQDVQVSSGTGERETAHGQQHANADKEHSRAVIATTHQKQHASADEAHSTVEGKHNLAVEEKNMSNTPKDMSPRHEKHVNDDDAAGVICEHRHKQEKHRDGALETMVSQEHGEKCQSVDDDCESKRAFSDENSPRERVHFSRGSTPDVDTPTRCARNPFSNPKPLKAGAKGIVSTERGPGSADGNPETPSTSWAFSARASIAPSKFDHMATLRMTYTAYKESSQGKEGVPLSLMQCSKTK